MRGGSLLSMELVEPLPVGGSPLAWGEPSVPVLSVQLVKPPVRGAMPLFVELVELNVC